MLFLAGVATEKIIELPNRCFENKWKLLPKDEHGKVCMTPRMKELQAYLDGIKLNELDPEIHFETSGNDYRDVNRIGGFGRNAAKMFDAMTIYEIKEYWAYRLRWTKWRIKDIHDFL